MGRPTQKEAEERRANFSKLDDRLIGPYLKEIAGFQPLKSEEEARLAVEIRKGRPEAVEKLVKSNLRFVVSVARTYAEQGVELADLVNEGNMGLIKAAYRFDESKNFRFISYAVWWIRQAILQALADQSRVVKLPVNRVGVICKAARTEERLEQRYQRAPGSDEIGAECGLDSRDVEAAKRVAGRARSLDSPVGESGEGVLADLLCDENGDRADEMVAEESRNNVLNKLLTVLTGREREVLRLYFGLDDAEEHTLDEVGEHLSLTRERVRQIRDQAMQRLRSMCPPELIKECMN